MQIFLGFELMFEYFRLPAPEGAIAPHWKLLPILQAAPGGKADGNEGKEQPRDLGFYG